MGRLFTGTAIWLLLLVSHAVWAWDCGCAVVVSGGGERTYTPCEDSPIEVSVTATATCGVETGSRMVTLLFHHDGVNPPAPQSGTILIDGCRQGNGRPCGPHEASYSVWFTRLPSSCRAGESGTYTSPGGGYAPAAPDGASALPRGTPGWQVGLGGDASGNASGLLRLAPEALFGDDVKLSAALALVSGERPEAVSVLRLSDLVRCDEATDAWQVFVPRTGRWVPVDQATARRYLADRRIRQVRTKECLVQVGAEEDSRLTLDFYDSKSVGRDYTAEGVYGTVTGAVPFASYAVTRPSGGVVRIEEHRGGVLVGRTDFVRRTGPDGMPVRSVVRGGNLVASCEWPVADDGTRRIVDTVTSGPNGFSNVVRRTYLRLGGRELVERIVEDPDGLARTTAYAYGTDPASSAYGRIVCAVRPSGLVVSNAYDAAGHCTETWEWIPGNPSVPVRRTVRSFAPLGVDVAVRDPAGAEAFTIPDDDGTAAPGVARDETEWVGGVAVSRTLRHATMDGRRHRIVGEVRLLDPSVTDVAAAWADVRNPFSLVDTMPRDGCKPCSERPSRMLDEDGTVTIYAYGSGAYAVGDGSTPGAFSPQTGGNWFRTIETRYPNSSLVPVPGMTVRDVTVEVRSSRQMVLRERWVATEKGDWERISWTETFRDAEGNEIATAASDGTRTFSTWANGRIVSRTDADGTVVGFAYDLLGRTVREVRSGGGLPEVVVETAYDPLDRILRRTESAGELSRGERWTYDALGRRTLHSATDGVVTRTFHRVDGITGISTETAVEGWGWDCAVTNETLTRADGRILRESVNGVIRTAYADGVDADGTRWVRTCLGPEGLASPRWSLVRTDALGRTVAVARPAFGVGEIVTSNRYDAAGRLAETAEWAAGAVLHRTLRAHDAYGSCVIEARDLDLDGHIGWAGPDRIASNAVWYVCIEGNWWREESAWSSGPDASDPTPVPAGSTRTRLTGLGASGPNGSLAAETVERDERGNETVSRTWRRGAMSVRETLAPGVSLPAVEVAVRGLAATNASPSGAVVSYDYDALGRPVAQFDGRGNRTSYAYDARGRIVSATDAAGNVTKFGYDARGRRTSVTDPLGNAVATAYDSEGRVLSVRGAACPVDWGYDAWGDRVSMATYRDGSLAQGDVTQWLRDAATGLVTNRVSADGRRTAYAYDALGRPVRRTDARGISTDYAYDAAGDLAQVSHSDGTPSAAFARDRAGRLVAAVTDGVSTNLLAYDAFGAVTNETQNGVAISRNYDNYGRLAAMDGAAYGYDALGRLASVEADGLSFTWLRVPGTDLPAGYVCGDFRRTVAYEPKRDLVAAVTNAFGDAVVSSFGYSNDAAGRRVMIKRGGSAFGDLAGSADSYGYNARSEVVTALREKDGSEVYGFLEDFAYDPIGNRTESAVYDENGVRYASAYETDERNRYVSRTVPGLAAARGDADARAAVTVNGNPAFRLGGYFYGMAAFDNTESGVDAEVETYAALPSDEEGGDDLVAAVTNRVHVPQSPEIFAYDANGNQTIVETPSGRWAVEWNAENRPVRWACGNRTLLMAYDHMGRRVRCVEITGGITNRVATFLYDGYLCIARTENGRTDRFLWDPTEPVATRPLATVADGTAYLYAHDANKNVSELVSARTGGTAAHYDYSSFGKTLIATGFLRNRNPFRFSSEYVDDATGLSYFNWRHYDPVHGRWLSDDPMFDELATDSRKMIDSFGIEAEIPYNPYLMCNNNPLGLFDITGEFAPAVAIAGEYAVEAAIAKILEITAIIAGAYATVTAAKELVQKKECRKPRCAPCDPPVGTLMYRLDAPEPGKEKDFRGHYPFLNQAHYHYTIVHQSPPPKCECFENKEYSIGYRSVTNADGIIPGAIPRRKPTGGGLMP